MFQIVTLYKYNYGDGCGLSPHLRDIFLFSSFGNNSNCGVEFHHATSRGFENLAMRGERSVLTLGSTRPRVKWVYDA